MLSHIGVLATLFAYHALSVSGIGENDIVVLPNVTFEYNHNTYSGYLHGDASGTYKMFYWLEESQQDPTNDPVILWLTGGPGCSSLSGAFTELGAFRVGRDGASLDENVFAWNKHANILFLESPAGVGYSYMTSDIGGYDDKGDNKTAEVNYNAMNDFFTRVQPKFRNHSFFITGESYAGVYLPTLAQRLVHAINAKKFSNPRFKGVAIGNGYMNDRLQSNSYYYWNAYHGIIGVDQWSSILTTCCNGIPVTATCDFYEILNSPTESNETKQACKAMLDETEKELDEGGIYNPYDYYHSCYLSSTPTRLARRLLKHRPLTRMNLLENSENESTADKVSYDSSDSESDCTCWVDIALARYLNNPDVMRALHVDTAWMESDKTRWTMCNYGLYDKYKKIYSDTTPIFEDVIASTKTVDFRFLIYNGDTDTVCDFLGDAWHISALAKRLNMSSNKRSAWNFRGELAGFTRRYFNSNVTIDLLTVKGAGHMVPSQCPGPSLQMLTNFLLNSANYSSTTGFDPTPKPRPRPTPVSSSSPTSEPTTTTSGAPPHVASHVMILSCAVVVALFV